MLVHDSLGWSLVAIVLLAGGGCGGKTESTPANGELRLLAGGFSITCVSSDDLVRCRGQMQSCSTEPGRMSCESLPESASAFGGDASHSLRMPGNVVSLAASGSHACGVLADGSLWCWGGNGGGERGVASGTVPDVPNRISVAARFRTVSVGFQTTCALTIDGAVYCWGRNQSGQLGDGTTADRAQPAVVGGGLIAVGVATAMDHACAWTAMNEVYCWGNNRDQKAVPGGPPNVTTPTRVTGVRAHQVVAANGHTCAQTGETSVTCWGTNESAQLGSDDATAHGPITLSLAPKLVGLYANGFRTCARAIDGLLCWGGNANGQLGDGSRSRRATPTYVLRGTIGAVALGQDHSCADADGRLWCWGWNASGAITGRSPSETDYAADLRPREGALLLAPAVTAW